MRSLVLAASVALTAMCAFAQGDAELLARDKRIKELFGREAYADAIVAINAQVAAATGTSWQDSLYSYVYKTGRAHWKVTGPETAAVAAEDLWKRIQSSKRAPQWEVKALIDLGTLYYDVGMLHDYFRADSMALSVATTNATRIPSTLLAQAHHALGAAHQDLGRFERAAPLYEKAVSICDHVQPTPVLLLAQIHGALGGCLRKLGRTREAERSFSAGLQVIAGDTSLAGMRRRSTLQGNLAILVQHTGDLQRSKAYCNKTLGTLNALIARLQHDPQQHDEVMMNRSRVYVNLASIYFSAGDYGRSLEYLQHALRDRKRVLGEGHPQVFALNMRFAELEAMAGKVDRAETLYLDQLRVVERTEGRMSEVYTDLLGRLARMAGRKGEYGRADSLYAAALPKDAASLERSTDPALAIILAERADVMVLQKRYQEAIADLLLSRSIRSRALGPRNPRLAGSDGVISNVALAMGDTLMARQFADSALLLLADRIAIYEKPFAPVAFPDPYAVANAIQARVAADRATVPDRGGEREWLQQLDMAITSLHRNKATVGDEASRLHLFAAQKGLFDLGLGIAYDAYARSHDQQDIQRFLDLSESDRSILLKSRLNSFTSLRYAGVPDRVLDREQRLMDDLRVHPDDRAAWDDLHVKEEAYSAFLDTLREHHPQYFALRYGEPQVTIADLRQQLVTPQRNVLAYATTKDHLYMLVVRSDTAALVRVSNAGLSEAVERLNVGINSRNTEAYVEAAHTLYKLAFAPVEALLTEEELLIIPDGALHKVNFEALLTKPDVRDFRLNLLIQRYAIAYLLSATTAVQFSELAQHRATGALALAPGFDDELKRRYTSSVADTTQLDRDYLRYVRQPFALSTAQGLGDLLSAKVMVGGDASEQHFRELARGYGILHLGTHAEMNENAPMYSRFVLSKDSAGVDADADGYLHAYEIYELDLRAQLAVLTACETGAGKNDDGEGVRSLGYSFAYAGCPSLVMSLWNIDEKVSSEIIARFYEHLADGLPKHEALRQAKLDHLNSATDELALPYYWAGMVLVGDVSPVDVGSNAMHYLWWVLGAVVLVMAAMLILRRRKVWNAALRE